MAQASLSDRAQVRAALPLIVVAGVIISLSMGIRQSMGLFQKPMAVDLGISASEFGFGMALQNLMWGVSQPVVGALGDRFGPRPVLLGGTLVYAAGLLLMALSPSTLLGLDFGGGVLIGIGVAATGFGVLLGAVSAAVPPAKRSWAVGIVSGAGSVGTMVIAPFGQAIIGAFDWQWALLAYMAIAALMGMFSVFVPRSGYRAGPAALGASQSTREALGEALGHRGYVAMTVAFFACGFQLMFIGTHFPRYLAMCGLAPSISAASLALIGGCNAIGSYMFGMLGTRYDKSKLLAGIYLTRTVAIITYLIVPISAPSTLIFASVMGFTWLGVSPLVSGLISGIFGLRHFNMLYGVVFLGHQAGAFTGALMGGVVLDYTGSYQDAWYALIAIGVAAAALQWPMDTRPVRRMAAA
ncbi:MAG: MFS transporter [Acetobacteraceae bacterium]|nr:MFS transporter [Acetobacteraceae bacterium]